MKEINIKKYNESIFGKKVNKLQKLLYKDKNGKWHKVNTKLNIIS